MNTSVDERHEQLALEPLRLAGPRPGFFSGTVQSIREIFAHRQLLGLLVRRELKARYKDSVLGFFWSLMRPLTLLLVYVIAIGKFLKAAESIPDFAIFVFTGLTAWTLFSEIVSVGTSSILNNSGLIKKVYLPREIFPLSVVGSALFNFAIQLVILIGATLVAAAFPTGMRWLYLPLSLAVIVTFGTALAFILSATNVYLRDVQYLVEVSMMVLFWASPIVYSWTLVHNSLAGSIWEKIYLWNPMTLAVTGFQRTFWVQGSSQPSPPNLGMHLLVALGIGLVFLWFSQRLFSRLQSNFAQEL